MGSGGVRKDRQDRGRSGKVRGGQGRSGEVRCGQGRGKLGSGGVSGGQMGSGRSGRVNRSQGRSDGVRLELIFLRTFECRLARLALLFASGARRLCIICPLPPPPHTHHHHRYHEGRVRLKIPRVNSFDEDRG